HERRRAGAREVPRRGRASGRPRRGGGVGVAPRDFVAGRVRVRTARVTRGYQGRTACRGRRSRRGGRSGGRSAASSWGNPLDVDPTPSPPPVLGGAVAGGGGAVEGQGLG